MKKLTRTLSVAQACVTMLSLVLFSMPSAAYATERNPEVEHKIDICHEGKVKNIDESGWNGHSDHPGDFIIDEGNPDHTSAKCTTPKVHDNGTLHVVKLINIMNLHTPKTFHLPLTEVPRYTSTQMAPMIFPRLQEHIQ